MNPITGAVSRIIPQQNQNEPKKCKRHFGNRGYFGASYAQRFAATPVGFISHGILKEMKKASELTPEETVNLRKATQTGLKSTGLYEKGVRVYHMSDIQKPKLKDTLKNLFSTFGNMMSNEGGNINPFKLLDAVIPKYSKKDRKALLTLREEISTSTDKTFKRISKFSSLLPEDAKVKFDEGFNHMRNVMLDIAARAQGAMFKTGQNACYISQANKIITPTKSLQTSVFHEMGHALNNNGGAILKTLQKVKSPAISLSGAILTASLLNKRKVGDEKSDNKVQNFFDGVKKNAGKLTFLAMTPVIAEEIIASVRGSMLAENVAKQTGELTKSMLKRIHLTNLGSIASYTMAGVTAGLGAAFAVKVKDKIQERYEAKKDAEYDAKDAKYQAKFEAKRTEAKMKKGE